MIGNDRVDAERFGITDLVDGGNAVVHGDDQLDALLVQRIDGCVVHTVALRLTGGDVVHHMRADRLKIRIQQRRGGHAVCVIVAVDTDKLLLRDSLMHAHTRFFHILNVPRRLDLGVVVQKILDLLRRGDAADLKQHGDNARKMILILNGVCLVFV